MTIIIVFVFINFQCINFIGLSLIFIKFNCYIILFVNYKSYFNTINFINFDYIYRIYFDFIILHTLLQYQMNCYINYLN